MRHGWSSVIRFPGKRWTCARRCQVTSTAHSSPRPDPTSGLAIPTRWISLDSTASIPDITLTPMLLFRVGRDLYGSRVVDAQEAIPLRQATRVPGASSFVRGLINLRGTITTVLDLGVRLDPSRAPVEDG